MTSESSTQSANDDAAAIEALSREARKSEFSGRVLLIDDDPLVVNALEYTLKSAGHEVRSTTRGKDIFRLAELLSPDLIVTDVIMSEIDIIQAIAEMRRTRPEVKIIAISGNAHLLTVATQHGATQVLAKPFDVQKLNALVKAVLQ